MDEFATFVKSRAIERTLKGLEQNQMKGYYAPDLQSLFTILEQLVQKGDTVSVGGSMTLFETGVIDWLRNYSEHFLDRYAPHLTPSDITQMYRACFSADVYITSTQAVTEAGELYNVDGRGNRVAAMTFGPDRVIVICGTNKLVFDEQAAIQRNKRVAAPANAKRLNRKTPCATLGYCTDCSSPDRICATHVTMKRQVIKDRIHVVLVDGSYGY